MTLAVLAALLPPPAPAAEPGPAPASQPPASRFDEAEAREVVGRLDADPTLQRVFQACPADVFGREASAWAFLRPRRPVPLATCEEHPEACFAQCVSGLDPDHCFSLARAFQEHEDKVEPRHAQVLFSMTCALGKGSGCTNRAASFRNRRYRGDPFGDVAEPEKQACEHRSFTVACDQGDAWGCAMLGQSYRYGEGTAANAGEARRLFGKSCVINPDFPACGFARDSLREMDAEGQQRPAVP